MKNCSNCGKESLDSASFCQYCGAPFSKESESKSSDVGYKESIGGSVAPQLPDNKDSATSNTPNIYNEPIPQNNGLVWLILSSVLTFFGCFCYGIGLLQVPTIIVSAIAVSKYNQKDYEGSKRMSKTSMILFFSLLGLSILIVIIVAIGLFSVIGTSEFNEIVEEFY